ncbi:MAG: 6-phosphogluconolactonase [bacterium]
MDLDDATRFSGWLDTSTTIVAPDAAALAERAAREVLADARAAIDARGQFTWVLSGGSTPRRLYARLAAPPFREQMPWDHTHVFWGDERHVPPAHPESDYGMAFEALLSKVPIPEAQVHRIEAELADAAEAARRYEATVRAAFQALGQPLDPVPSFDLVLLGLGADGHTASLFPGSAAIQETRSWVAAPYVEKFRTHRITLTPTLFNAARHVVFLVSGSDKADAVHTTQRGRTDPRWHPAQAIRPSHGRLTWLVDAGAAARLATSEPGATSA